MSGDEREIRFAMFMLGKASVGCSHGYGFSAEDQRDSCHRIADNVSALTMALIEEKDDPARTLHELAGCADEYQRKTGRDAITRQVDRLRRAMIGEER